MAAEIHKSISKIIKQNCRQPIRLVFARILFELDGPIENQLEFFEISFLLQIYYVIFDEKSILGNWVRDEGHESTLTQSEGREKCCSSLGFLAPLPQCDHVNSLKTFMCPFLFF